MNLWNVIRDFLGVGPGTQQGRRLRNKAGGMAWIKNTASDLTGLDGRIVKTIRVNASGHWEIEPEQRAVARVWLRTDKGGTAWPGDAVVVTAIDDDLLEPIREVGEGEQDESVRYLPPVPARGVPA